MSGSKPGTIPSLRMSAQLRAAVENVLEPGETLSAFVMDAVERSIVFRKSQMDFLARGIAGADRAGDQCAHASAAKAMAGLRKRLAAARG